MLAIQGVEIKPCEPYEQHGHITRILLETGVISRRTRIHVARLRYANMTICDQAQRCHQEVEGEHEYTKSKLHWSGEPCLRSFIFDISSQAYKNKGTDSLVGGRLVGVAKQISRP